MIKDFNRWNMSKQKIDQSDRSLNFHEREIWWCSIGVNIGSEQHSQTSDFSRPVLIFKKFTERMFWGIPTTTKTRSGEYRFCFCLNGIKNDLLMLQTRSFDSKRLIRKIGNLSEGDFKSLTESIGKLFLDKTKTPCGVFSEAEASVCGLSVADEICLSNEVNYLLSRGEFNE
jgi:mRNA interferase MazF